MSFLADLISKNNELEMVTDIKRYSSLLMKNEMKISKSLEKKIRVSENEINFAIPGDLRNVSVESIIQLRNREDFNEMRKAYVGEIARLIESKEKSQDNSSLVELLSYEKDFRKICGQFLNMTALATLNVYSFAALSNTGARIPAVAAIVADCMAVKNAVSDTSMFIERLKTKHLARKYVAKIGELDKTKRR
jgi:hypothetical protein